MPTQTLTSVTKVADPIDLARVLQLVSTVLAGLATLAGFVAGPVVFVFTGNAFVAVVGLLVVGATAAGRMVARMITEYQDGAR